MNLTHTQQIAVKARGNVLVVAGAGTGKTHTLVERCLHCLLDEKSPASVDEILMVTFTDAAAAEMRRRIRARLEEEMRAEPANPRWAEQLALFETAHIGTLHSFCLELVRQHFYALELDPQLSVLAEEEAHLLAEEELEKMLHQHYAGKSDTAAAVQQLIQDQFKGWEKPVRALILRLHRYSQTLPDSSGWFRDQFARFNAPEPVEWVQWLTAELAAWRERSLHFLEKRAANNGLAAQSLAVLKALSADASRAETAAALERIRSICRGCPHGKKGEWQRPLDAFVEDMDFLFSVANVPAEGDPLLEDWKWIRGQMVTLLQLAKDFGEAYANAKRELAMLDFHDLEQHALRLLWDPAKNTATDLAREWQRKLRFIFVDEYQDINAAQDRIVEALSRGGTEANRFLVGDVKQSIYRFRLADPSIFQGYLKTWSGPTERARPGHSNSLSTQGPSEAHKPPLDEAHAVERSTLLCPSRARSVGAPSQIIPLVDNFRSREGILDFINSVFPGLMRAEIGGVEYDGRARLRFGEPGLRKTLTRAADSTPRVEFHLRIKRNSSQPENVEDESSKALLQLADLEEADKEARVVALRLRGLHAEKHLIWDEGQMRPMEWRDVAILLRSPARKAESYARQFARLNIPLLVARGGFYESLEVMDLLSLLQILDNPLQDVPVLAVLRSPLVGLRLNELAEIRLSKKGHFWSALTHWEMTRIQNAANEVSHNPDDTNVRATDHEPRTTNESQTLSKVSQFLSRFSRWRRLARQVSLSQCLNAILAETHYASWLLTQTRGEQRQANVQRLLALARQFDQFQRQGLFRFLLFIEAQQLAETEPDVPAVSDENSVRIMSIHQSKGLEFPIVIVADLGKSFNLMDTRADIILDQQFGICPHVKPPHTGKRYPSLPYWLAANRQQRELLGEELRLLYVAMTRARDMLLLTGSISEGRLEKACERAGEMDEELIASARSCSEWLLSWLVSHAVSEAGADGMTRTLSVEGQSALVRWILHEELRLLSQKTAPQNEEAAAEVNWKAPPAVWQALQERLAWRYPFIQASREPAKTTVSTLRRRAAIQDDVDEDSIPLFWERPKPRIQTPWPGRRRFASGEEVGQAHHRFLQFASLAATGSGSELQLEAERLVRENVINSEQAALLDFEGLAAFWQSVPGQKVRAEAQHVRRELPFTARFSLAELQSVADKAIEPASADEFVVVQGIADLVVMRPEEIWLLDFKTDSINPDQLAEKTSLYETQLKLYASALSRIYRRPVTQAWLYFLSVRQAVSVVARTIDGSLVKIQTTSE